MIVERTRLGVHADRPLAAVAAALLVVAREHAGAPRATVRLNDLLLTADLPGDRLLSSLPDEAEALLTKAGELPGTGGGTVITATVSPGPDSIDLTVVADGDRLLEQWVRAIDLLRTAPDVRLSEADLRTGDGPVPSTGWVARVFAEVLDVPVVEPTDNFFDLGGTSLLALRVWSRLRTELGQDFEVRHIFDAPTVADLAAVLARTAGGPRRPSLIPRS